MTDTEQAAMSETVLVAQAGAGDTGAFEALHRRHAEAAWHLAGAITGDASLAAAAVPEGFATVFTALRAGRTSPESAFRTQLLAATRNAALDLVRSRPAPEAEIADDDALPVEVAFRQLPERWRSVLWLTGVEGMSPAEAAPIVGLAPEATAQLTERARGGLGEQFLQAHLSRTGDRNCSRAVVRLGAYATGTLIEADAEKLERHLGLCPECSDRFAGVHDIDGELSRLALPAPVLLVDDSRDAWSAALATRKHRTATGLSPRTEKVVAGVSVVAAAAGVLGAALLGGSDPAERSDQAAPRATLATETAPAALDLDRGLDIPAFGSGATAPDTAASPAAGAASAGAGGASTGGLVVGARSSGSTPGEVAGDSATPTAPAAAPDPIGAEGPDGASPGADEPVVSVSTTIAGIPVAVEVGTDPGVTVGPVTVGSEPEPERETGTEANDGAVEVGGPLEPVVEPVEQVVEPVEQVVETVSGVTPAL